MTVCEPPPGKKLNQCLDEKDNSNQEIQTECSQSSNSIMISPLINEDNVNHENDLCQPISASTDYFNMEKTLGSVQNSCTLSTFHDPQLPLLDLTPKSRKIKALRSKIKNINSKMSRMKRKLVVTSSNKHSLTMIREMLKKILSYNEYLLASIMIRHSQCKPTGRRWTQQEKSIALNIYLKSSSAYNALRKIIDLPSVKTLKQSIGGIANCPGFCPVLLQSIKATADKMSVHEKMCILSFDEMNIKSGLQYNRHLDLVTGYGYKNNDKIATKALVFMVRGISKKWKQLIGYFFLSNCTPVSVLKELVLDAIGKIFETGLQLVAMVCDQSPVNQRLYVDLKISSSSPFFQFNKNKICAFFDVPHLIKSVCNNLKKYILKFDKFKTAKWCFIQQLYDIDSCQKFRVVPHLTKAHMETRGLSSMKVKLATQVLSHSVAAGICLLTATGHLSSEASYTAEFIGEMDELFDSFNSRTFYNAKKFACAVSKNSQHIEMWKQKFKWIESWQFMKTDNRNITPPCKKGWLLTISAAIELWKHVNDCGLEFLLTNRLNQDCLENTFSCIRKKGGFNNNPDCVQFQSAIRSVMSHNLLKSSNLANCEDDDDNILTSAFNNKDICIIQNTSTIESSDVNNTELSEKLSLCQSITTDTFNFLEKNVITYIAGYLANKILIKFNNCKTCEFLLITEENLDPNTLLIQFKQYELHHGGLKYPTAAFNEIISEMSFIYHKYIECYFKLQGVAKLLYERMNSLNFNCLEHIDHTKSHIASIKKMLIDLFIKVMLLHKIKVMNAELKNENKTKLKHMVNI